MEQKIIISKNFKDELAAEISACEHDKVFVLVDDTTKDKCLPFIAGVDGFENAGIICIEATDAHKNLDTLAHAWRSLGNMGATRHSCLVNIGGGMVTDLGGFAASTFKRGLNFINIPTTLLAMVDASVGGKTGINFNGLKNEIGVFRDADAVIINTEFLKTLDSENIRSGYAEMIKHGLIDSDSMWRSLMDFDILTPDLSRLQGMVADSIKVKERIVEIDPHEKGLRKALNLGHTIGHAFEAMALHRKTPILHGYAVAFGLVCELYLSCIKEGFPVDKMRQTANYIKDNYGRFDFSCDDYCELIELMKHDKKNVAGTINFTLLEDTGKIKTDRTVTKAELTESLDFLREGL